MNKTISTAAVLGIIVLSSIMQGQGTREATQQRDKQLLDCHRVFDPNSVFPSETCAVILSYMAPADQLGPVGEDGEFLVLSPASDGTSTINTYYLPPKLRSEIALNQLRETISDAQYMGSDMHGLFAELAIQGINFWPKMRDVYCYYHPRETYLGISEEKERCPGGLTLPQEKTLEGYFEAPQNFSINYHTFLNTLQAEEIDNRNSQK